MITPVENLLGYQALFAWRLVGPNCLGVLRPVRWVGLYMPVKQA